jgi:CheY-like chemotaxis protein
MGDSLRLRQVLINLVGNALKFTEQGGIEVEVMELGTTEGRICLKFSVKDTGNGLSPGQVSALFAPFSQAEASTSRRFGGTGLGLAISKRLVELMNGEIWVESNLGFGSEFQFTVELPVAQDQSVPLDLKPLPMPQDWAPRINGVRVLVVDDHALNGELTSLLLGQMGVQVNLASSGTEGFHMAELTRYDLILMDLDLPDMDGFETTRRIRSAVQNQDRPIVALTAHALSTHRIKCLEAGMNDCLT